MPSLKSRSASRSVKKGLSLPVRTVVKEAHCCAQVQRLSRVQLHSNEPHSPLWQQFKQRRAQEGSLPPLHMLHPVQTYRD